MSRARRERGSLESSEMDRVRNMIRRKCTEEKVVAEKTFFEMQDTYYIVEKSSIKKYSYARIFKDDLKFSR